MVWKELKTARSSTARRQSIVGGAVFKVLAATREVLLVEDISRHLGNRVPQLEQVLRFQVTSLRDSVPSISPVVTSQNYGPLLVMDYITAPYLGVPKWDPNFGNYPCASLKADMILLMTESDASTISQSLKHSLTKQGGCWTT